MPPTPPRVGKPRLLLVGAGHAHLHLIRHHHRLEAAEITLVDPGSFWYSGRATSLLSARHSPAEIRLDPVRLAGHFGVKVLRGRLAHLDPAAGIARLEDGRALDFSLLSLNLGSCSPCPEPCTPGPGVWGVKPLPRLLALRHRLEQEFSRGRTPRLVIVGGGPSGVEVACQLRELARRHGAHPEILLVTRGQQLLEGAPRGAIGWLMRQLARREIEVRFGLEVTGHAANGVTFTTESNAWGEDSLQWLAADHVVHAEGLVPPAVVERLGLPLIPHRGLAVEATLQCPGYPDIFAIGDCAAMLHHELPRLRIYGIRQARVLLDNLAARLSGDPLIAYVPQRRALAILDLGAGQGLAIRGHHWWGGRLALALKTHLDRRFLRQYRL